MPRKQKKPGESAISKTITEDPAMTPTALGIVTIIFQNTSTSGWAEMTQQEIADSVHRSRVTVQRALRLLKERGHVETEVIHVPGQRFKSLRYRLKGV